MEQDTNIEGNHHSQLAYPAHQSSNHRENWMTVSNPLTRAPFLGDEVWIRESKYKQRQIIDDNTISPPTKHKQEDGFETGAEPITREPTDLHKRFGNQHTMTKHELGMVLGLLVHQRELLNRRSNSNSSGEDPRLHPLPPPRTKERIQKLQQSSSGSKHKRALTMGNKWKTREPLDNTRPELFQQSSGHNTKKRRGQKGGRSTEMHWKGHRRQNQVASHLISARERDQHQHTQKLGTMN